MYKSVIFFSFQKYVINKCTSFKTISFFEKQWTLKTTQFDMWTEVAVDFVNGIGKGGKIIKNAEC